MKVTVTLRFPIEIEASDFDPDHEYQGSVIERFTQFIDDGNTSPGELLEDALDTANVSISKAT